MSDVLLALHTLLFKAIARAVSRSRHPFLTLNSAGILP